MAKYLKYRNANFKQQMSDLQQINLIALKENNNTLNLLGHQIQ